jgi:hypothetical protein
VNRTGRDNLNLGHQQWALAAALLVGACGSSEDCRPAVLNAIDEAHGCLLPAAEVVGLSFCHPAGQVRTKGLRPICLVRRDGQRFTGYIATDESVNGSGFIEVAGCDSLPPPLGGGLCAP